jgi:hypothetical protein
MPFTIGELGGLGATPPRRAGRLRRLASGRKAISPVRLEFIFKCEEAMGTMGAWRDIS